MRAQVGRAAVLAALVAVPAAAVAEPLFSTKGRPGLFSSQIAVLEGRAARQYENSVRLRPDYDPDGTRTPAYTGSYRGQYLDMAKAAARRHGVPEDLFLRLIQQESGWSPSAESVKGAYGLAQLMPATARVLGVDRTDPFENLEGGARYLRQQYDRFGNWRLALAAYNAGPEAVVQYDGVPPYAETQNYVKVIWGS